MKSVYKIISLAMAVLMVGGVVGYTIGFSREHSILVKELDKLYPLRLNSQSYKFINPLLAFVIPSADQDDRLSSLKNKISDLISTEKQKGLVKASVFMFDLNQGRWIGVNEDDVYPPASMFKVVIMVAYFQGAEQTPGLLDDELIYTADIDKKTKTVVVNSKTSLKVGTGYTISELINKMIIDSDNGAEELLLKHMNKDYFNKLFAALDIKPFGADGSFFISPRQYSLFFRIIYNATFLGIDFSEKALSILSETTFKDGLVAGVDSGTIVAHKFGQYATHENGKTSDLQLHDCGIIYYPQNPYFLCVMTKGDNLNNLKDTIKNISSIVYQNYSALE